MKSFIAWTLIALAGSSCVSCKNGTAEAPTHQAIHDAILGEDLTVLDRALKEGIDVNEFFVIDDGLESACKTTLLHAACFADDRQAVKTLLDSGANPNLRDGFDRLPVELAIDRNAKDVTSVLEDFQLKKDKGDTIDHMEIIGIVLRRRAEDHQEFRAVTVVGSDVDGDRIRELLVSMGLRITKSEEDPVMSISIDRATPSRVDYSVDMEAGPLNGGFDQGSFQKTHGFWIHTNVAGGVR